MKIKNYSSTNEGVLYNWLPHDLDAEEVVFFPDACPGRSPLPTGTAVFTKQENWRKFAVSDIGCGMLFIKSNLYLKDFTSEKWDELYWIMKGNKSENAQIGSGNHFLTCYTNDKEELYFVIHTGSRLEGKAVEDLIDKPNLFDKAYEETIKWAEENRFGIKRFVDKVFGETEVILDKVHNSFEKINDGVIIRKGSVKVAPGELTIVPSNMDGDMVLVRAKEAVDNVLNGLFHGTGRLMSRSDSKKYAELYDYEALRKRICIPNHISNASIKTEAPFCYRDLDSCLELVSDLAEEVDRFTPIAYIGQI